MLPVQILIFAMGSINSIVDGTMAGRYIDANSVGVIGLYFSMVNVMNTIGSVLLGGTTVLCGRYMGRGELQKTEGIFSLNLTVTFLVGALLTILSVFIPGPIADILGANEVLRADLMKYIVVYAIGIIPMLLSQQLAAFLQMERQSKRGYIGIVGMIISNVALDITFVGILKWGIWGLALATSLSNTVYFLILVPYYFSSKSQLHYGVKKILWNELFGLIKIGFPGAMLFFCLALRGIVINRVLLKYAGNDGLSAMSSFDMVRGIMLAFCLGIGSVVRMLISVFVGEEDKASMKKLLKLVFTKGMAMACAFAAFMLLISPFVVYIFFPDRTSNVYHLSHQLFVIYSFCVPLILVCQIFTNYLQATGHNLFVNIQSVFDGFFSMVIPSLILAPIIGAMGVWLSNPIGIVMTILTVPIYDIIYWKRIPRNMDEWMFLSPNFGVSKENFMDIPIHNLEEVSAASARIQEFCEQHDVEKKSSYYAALCLEEMAGNVVKYGFSADNKRHSLNSIVMFKKGDIVLRIKDDCVPFNPKEMSDLIKGNENFDNIGIRVVMDIAKDVNYQNMLGLNVLTITISQDDLITRDDYDFLLERKLRKLDPKLHSIFRDTVFSTQKILSNYKLLFPEYTDHSELHSMTVIASCNRLIGKEQIEKLNADEIFVLLVGCYLHDSGMGIGERDYEEFKEVMNPEQFLAQNPGATRADFVRTYHNEFSGLFVEKYADLFEFPSDEHTFAVKQIVRGHRKTDLYNEKEYPSELKLPSGNTVCLPYLSALIRLADEIDVVATRNPLILYDINTLTDEIEIIENKKLEAIKNIRMTNDSFILSCETDDEEIYESVKEMVAKMQKTLDYCREVVEKRTPYKIRQKNVILK